MKILYPDLVYGAIASSGMHTDLTAPARTDVTARTRCHSCCSRTLGIRGNHPARGGRHMCSAPRELNQDHRRPPRCPGHQVPAESAIWASEAQTRRGLRLPPAGVSYTVIWAYTGCLWTGDRARSVDGKGRFGTRTSAAPAGMSFAPLSTSRLYRGMPQRYSHMTKTPAL